MNVDEALRQFALDQEFPKAAMLWALTRWEEASPRFISRLRAHAAGGVAIEGDEMFFIVHLCGEKGDARAYEPLCRLIATDPDIEDWLGDGTTETLPGILIKLFDGDVEPLTKAIESPKGDECSRGSALLALGYLVRNKGVLSDEQMRQYLRKLYRESVPREDSGFWLTWAETAAALGYDDLRSEVATLNKDGFLLPRDFNLKDFDQTIDLARNDPSGLEGFRECRVYPLGDAVGTLEGWGGAGEDDFDVDEEYEPLTPLEAPYVNPFRGVGRNDPCPCGSGRKYKKCCFEA
jgi:uncharacterized protein